MQQGVGEGGFFFPKVYRESKAKVLELLQQGQMELIETSRWTLADEFMAFILQTKFLEFADHTYPTPREKTEVPIWFLVSCQLVMKTHLQKSYVALGALLRAGPILSRVGFNVLAALGFNDKNRKDRVTPVHHDSVRKFFKDTDAATMRRWFSTDMQRWFEQFDSPHAVIDSYRLRTSVEECFRQFKIAWRIGDFPSPHRSLLEAHVGFTLLTYSLLQLYLMREDLQKKTRSHITQLKREEHNLDQPVVVFAGDYFGQFENKDLWKLALDLPKEVQQKLRQSIDDSPHQF